MRPIPSCLLLALLAVFVLAAQAQAHFGMTVPDRNLLAADGPREVGLDIRFWHPMENVGMSMEKPKLEVFEKGGKKDASAGLSPVTIQDRQAWKATHAVRGPGVVAFVTTPEPYWEPAEKKFIRHVSKTVISAYGDEEGWDKPVGAKLEIVPMVKPFALYAGNVFTGKVLYKGKPLANAEVEIEFFNKDGVRKAPADAYVTQAVKTDAGGVFHYAAPWAGWWGFAALTQDDAKLKKDGKEWPVELGGVVWVYFHPLP